MTETRRINYNPGEAINGRYVIERELGRGAYGKVFKARDNLINRDVAVKVIIHAHGEKLEVFWERFHREVQLLGKLKNPGAVAIYDVGVEDKTPFLVMELIQGVNLRQELNDHGPMEASRALAIFRSALEVLSEAHDMKIIHRDLKPENLMLEHPNTPDERVKVLDFGLAHKDRDARLTLEGQMMGTVEYLAPEYINNNDISPAVDIYQMGLILIELFTSRPVIPNDTAIRMVGRHTTNKLPIPDALLGSELGPVIMDALAPDPADRFQNASDMLKAMAHITMDNAPKLSPETPCTELNVIVREASGPGGHTQKAVHQQVQTSQSKKRAGLIILVVFVTLFILWLILF